MINFFEDSPRSEEGLHCKNDILANSVPGSLVEEGREPVRTRGFVRVHFEDNTFDLLSSDRPHQVQSGVCRKSFVYKVMKGDDGWERSLWFLKQFSKMVNRSLVDIFYFKASAAILQLKRKNLVAIDSVLDALVEVLSVTVTICNPDGS